MHKQRSGAGIAESLRWAWTGVRVGCVSLLRKNGKTFLITCLTQTPIKRHKALPGYDPLTP